LPECQFAGAPMCNGTCPPDLVCADTGSCECVPDWPGTPGGYTPGPVSYMNTLTVPGLDAMSVPTCCKDFGPISKDFIQSGTNNIDNALANLAGSLVGLGVDIQALLTSAITDGTLAMLLDHRSLDAGALPDDFVLAQLLAEFAPGTTYTEANAGTGSFLLDPASFVGATGEPQNFNFPSVMGTPAMSAGPFTFGLTLPLGFVTLDIQAFETDITGDHGTISAAGIPYTNGTLAAYILLTDVYGAINALLNSPECSCLGLTQDVYTQQPDGSFAATGCVANADLLCALPEEEVCVSLADPDLFGNPSGVLGACLVLPGVLNGQADIDLNADPTVYEGMSIGLEYTGTTAAVTGLLP